MKYRFKKKFLHILLILLMALGISYQWVWPKKINDVKIESFYHNVSANHLILKFTSKVPSVFVATLDEVPDTIALNDLNALRLAYKSDTVRIPISQEQNNREYSIIVYLQPKLCSTAWKTTDALFKYIPYCKPKKYLEIIRQSEKYLLNTLNFHRPLGYSILGRKTIESMPVKANPPPPLIFYGNQNLNIEQIQLPQRLDELLVYTELKKATQIIHFLLDQKIFTGPFKKRYADFLLLTFDEKLKKLANNEYAVMCGGFRDLFLHGSLNLIQTRAVNMLNHYSPSSPDLAAYTHALAEVWVSALNQWVAIDPWLAVIFQNAEGHFLSAEQLAKSKQPNKIKIIPLKEVAIRQLMNGQNEYYQSQWYPDKLKMTEWTTAPNAIPGYIEYFKVLFYRDYIVK